MPSFKKLIENNQCQINVLIKSTKDRNPKTFIAMIDTGAQSTCISKNVVKLLNLISKGKLRMQSATEIKSVNTYYVDLIIPIFYTEPIIRDNQIKGLKQDRNYKNFYNLKVQEMYAEFIPYDILLGMDVLMKCNFIMAHGEFILGY